MLVHLHGIDDVATATGRFARRRPRAAAAEDEMVGALLRRWKGQVIVVADHGLHTVRVRLGGESRASRRLPLRGPAHPDPRPQRPLGGPRMHRSLTADPAVALAVVCAAALLRLTRAARPPRRRPGPISPSSAPRIPSPHSSDAGGTSAAPCGSRGRRSPGTRCCPSPISSTRTRPIDRSRLREHVQPHDERLSVPQVPVRRRRAGRPAPETRARPIGACLDPGAYLRRRRLLRAVHALADHPVGQVCVLRRQGRSDHPGGRSCPCCCPLRRTACRWWVPSATSR